MVANYRVEARVVDIRNDIPQKSDILLVDCNAWYWHTYSRASLRPNGPKPEQLQHYPKYIDAAIEAGATIYCSTHTLTELCGIIERAEAEIYAKDNNLPNLDMKTFRHQPDQVIATFRKEVDAVWAQITSMAKHIGQEYDQALSERLVAMIGRHRVDAYDALVLLLAQDHNVTRVLTDDGDFSTVPGFVIHTANERVLSAALRMRKLEPARTMLNGAG